MPMDKQTQRRLMKAKLLLIDHATQAEMSSLVSKNLSQLLSSLNVIQQKICIGAFAPIAQEPRLDLLHSAELEKLTSYPAFNQDLQVMIFKMSRWGDLVLKKDFGPEILGPAADALEVTPGLILIPGLVFGANGDRLGRGKGFYDKYLSGYRGIKIGICFGMQVVEMLPTETHDIPLDYIVTEEKIIKCKRA